MPLKVFISHVHQESQIANLLQDEIEGWLGRQVQIFNTSQDSLEPGAHWLDALTENLQECDILLVVATPNSVRRPWVNFETGGVWALSKVSKETDKLVVPCCANQMKVRDLPVPLNLLEAVDLTVVQDVTKLFKMISKRTPAVELPKQFNAEGIAERFAQTTIPVSDQTDDRFLQLERHIDQAAISIIKSFESLVSKPISDTQTFPNEPDIFQRESFLIDRLLGVDYDALSNIYEEKYELRYRLGEWRGEIRQFESRCLDLTEPITSKDGTYQFRAMRYLTTKDLFFKYSGIGKPKPSEAYLPYIVLSTNSEQTKTTTFEQEWESTVVPFIDWLQGTYFTGKQLRLPTIEEWLTLASPIDEWSFEKRIRKCNIKMQHRESRQLAAVGCFPDSISQYGCFDVIGNAWELCLEKQSDIVPSKVMGWSYKDRYQKKLDWWQSTYDLIDTDDFVTSFRLIVIE